MQKKLINKIFILLAILFLLFACIKLYAHYFNVFNEQNVEFNDDESPNIVLYSKAGCIYCIKARELLDQRKIKYKLIELSNNRDLHLKLAHKTGQTSVPYIFINDKFIGGFDDLKNIKIMNGRND